MNRGEREPRKDLPRSRNVALGRLHLTNLDFDQQHVSVSDLGLTSRDSPLYRHGHILEEGTTAFDI